MTVLFPKFDGREGNIEFPRHLCLRVAVSDTSGAKPFPERCRVERKRFSEQKCLVLKALNGVNRATANTQQRYRAVVLAARGEFGTAEGAGIEFGFVALQPVQHAGIGPGPGGFAEDVRVHQITARKLRA